MGLSSGMMSIDSVERGRILFKWLRSNSPFQDKQNNILFEILAESKSGPRWSCSSPSPDIFSPNVGYNIGCNYFICSI